MRIEIGVRVRVEIEAGIKIGTRTRIIFEAYLILWAEMGVRVRSNVRITCKNKIRFRVRISMRAILSVVTLIHRRSPLYFMQSFSWYNTNSQYR